MVFAAPVMAEESCPPAEKDPNGYLRKICQYILERNVNVEPGRPRQYKIKQLTELERDGKKLVEVRLDCCYMGDSALIDKASGEVLSFRLGPK